MNLIKPRLTDYYDVLVTQDEVGFAIPFLDEDLPLFLDPMLLWKSTVAIDNALHSQVVAAFNGIGELYKSGKQEEAKNILVELSECKEVGLGSSATRKGRKISLPKASEILSLFVDVPYIAAHGLGHIEAIQLLTDDISIDRVSDITCNLLKSTLIDFTIDQCTKFGIPLKRANVENVYDFRTKTFKTESINLPVDHLGNPIILIPKEWLKHSPWINFEDYFKYYQHNQPGAKGSLSRASLISFNRSNYDLVRNYLKLRELTSDQLHRDPLFSALPVISAKRALSNMLKLPTGKTDGADKKYEDLITKLFTSMLYPNLDFADSQSRTEDGVLIRDLIFYNNKSFDFLEEIHSDYGSRQLVFEMKNVAELEGAHVSQLNRYLKEQFGRFGVIVTRKMPSKAVYKNTIDLWSSHRKCIIILDDEDIKTMCLVYESKQRLPVEVLKKKYVQFTRDCPS